MRKTRILLAYIGLALAAASTAAAGLQSSSDYRIGARDLLEITVLGVAEINKLVVRVSEDGLITLPLLGEVNVNNLTRSEVERELTRRVGEKYVRNPQVTVFIQEYLSKRVSVLGAVERPGPFELLGRQTVLSVISQAGGLTRDAGKEIIVIRQVEGGDSTTFRIPIDDLFIKGEAKLNIPLEPDDIVTVPVDKLVPIYVFGQVRNPGALQVRKSSLPTLTQAIAQAGGFSDRAVKSKVKIRRKDASGKDLEITVNVRNILRGRLRDIPLQENDTVYVPESLF